MCCADRALQSTPPYAGAQRLLLGVCSLTWHFLLLGRVLQLPEVVWTGDVLS